MAPKITKHPSRRRIVRNVDDLPRDHWMARQLPKGTPLRRYAEERAITTVTRGVHLAIDEAGLTRAEVAHVLGNTKSYVSQVLNGYSNMTLRTLGALLWAAGRQVVELRTEVLGTAATAQQPRAMLFMSTTSNVPTGQLVYYSTQAPSEYAVEYQKTTPVEAHNSLASLAS